MSIKRGYNYSDYETMYLELDGNDRCEAVIEISGVETDGGGGSSDYGATVIMDDKKIIKFRIKSYDIELEIPATIQAHNAIKQALAELEGVP